MITSVSLGGGGPPSSVLLSSSSSDAVRVVEHPLHSHYVQVAPVTVLRVVQWDKTTFSLLFTRMGIQKC